MYFLPLLVFVSHRHLVSSPSLPLYTSLVSGKPLHFSELKHSLLLIPDGLRTVTVVSREVERYLDQGWEEVREFWEFCGGL